MRRDTERFLAARVKDLYRAAKRNRHMGQTFRNAECMRGVLIVIELELVDLLLCRMTVEINRSDCQDRVFQKRDIDWLTIEEQFRPYRNSAVLT